MENQELEVMRERDWDEDGIPEKWRLKLKQQEE